MALMSYLLKDRHGTYYFRRVIPTALRPFMPEPWRGKANWKRTLATKKPAEAKVRASKALSECTADLQAGERARRGEWAAPAALNQGTLSLHDLERDTLADLLAADEAERRDGDDRRHLQTPEERTQWPDLALVAFGRRGMAEDHSHAYGEELGELAGEYRRALARSDPKIVEAELRAALKKRGVPIDPTSDLYYEAGLAMLRAHVNGYGFMLERQRGGDIPTPQPSSWRGPTLSEAYDAWKAGSPARGSRKPSDRTLLEADHAVRRLREMHGDLRLGGITREKAREFRDALARVPTRLPAKLKALPIRDVLKTPATAKLPPPHGNTINKSLTLLSAIVSYAVRNGLMDAVPGFVNPFANGLKLAVDDRKAQGREPFTMGDLGAIFATPVYRSHHRPEGGGEEAAFWLPLIALLTGARQGELAQLRTGDLKQDAETGIWFFDIGTEGGRSIKTRSSRRKVPVHPELERVGLLRYRQHLLDLGASPHDTLWPAIKSDGQGRRAGPWSKWFNRYLRMTAKVEDEGKVFHSFRHTFKRMARDAGLPEEMHDALTGHSGGGVGRSYGAGFGLMALSEALGRLGVPTAVGELRWSAGNGPKRRSGSSGRRKEHQAG